ncbi:winged helix-turn-helix transcriptional regulator [archaeon]|nr:winged helix-turn-helix transcriptional regulator [archaeon]
MKEQKPNDCSLIKLYAFLGKRWTYPLLYNISKSPKSYNNLYMLSKKTINPTLLAERLREFIKFDIIKRQTIGERVFYSTTKNGEKLKDILNQIRLLSKDLKCYLPKDCKERCCSKCKIFKKTV